VWCILGKVLRLLIPLQRSASNVLMIESRLDNGSVHIAAFLLGNPTCNSYTSSSLFTHRQQLHPPCRCLSYHIVCRPCIFLFVFVCFFFRLIRGLSCYFHISYTCHGQQVRRCEPTFRFKWLERYFACQDHLICGCITPMNYLCASWTSQVAGAKKSGH
jgi:hypothetical protein